jgi:AAA+ superfamily predicted ATPase
VIKVTDARDGNTGDAGATALNELLKALGRLDSILQRASSAAKKAYGVEAGGDSLRGLHIQDEDVDRLFERIPGASVLHTPNTHEDAGLPSDVAIGSRLGRLADAYGLTAFDLDVLVLALAPELDLAYQRLYAYLQDDVTRRHPSVDLALNLFSEGSLDKLRRRRHFAAGAPLFRNHVLRLFSEPSQPNPPLLGHYLEVDEQIVRYLLDERSLDERLAAFAEWIQVPAVSLEELQMNRAARASLVSWASSVRGDAQSEPRLLHLHEVHGSGRRQVAEAIARQADKGLLAVEISRVLAAAATPADFERTARLLLREACLGDGILYLDEVDALRTEDRAPHLQGLLRALSDGFASVILTGRREWASPEFELGKRNHVLSVGVPLPDLEQRRDCWRSALESAQIVTSAREMDELAARFRLTSAQIVDAVAQARCQLAAGQGEASADAKPSTARDRPRGELLAAARSQSARDLAALARKVELRATWGDIVVPSDTMMQLRELCARVANGHQVLAEWGFGLKPSSGRGTTALFAGPSGTGKTMAAEIVGNELGLDVYKVDLSGIVSKYIGETEKNLERIFTAADTNAILFFDEADALFGKRSEVRDSHDRYANVEISYLLQRMESYEGIAILATNLRQNMDEAFVRRLHFIVDFPFPDELERERIWQVLMPKQAPQSGPIDWAFFARHFKLAGGNIRNITLAAAFLAAAEGSPIRSEHILRATRREYQKLGKALPAGVGNGVGAGRPLEGRA